MAARVRHRRTWSEGAEDRHRRAGGGFLSGGTTKPAGLNRTRLTTAAPTPFDFTGTAVSHGWVSLAPNRWVQDSCELLRTERLPAGEVVYLAVSGAGSQDRPRLRIDVRHGHPLTGSDKSAIRRLTRRMFRLDEDLEPFHRLCRRFGGRWLETTCGLGRLLRSPTVFEDAVKTLCTTNVQWGGTRAMVERLVELLGAPGPDTDASQPRAFPTPEVIAGADGETLASARLGYRAPFVRELARRVAVGELDLESLLAPEMSTGEARKRLLGIKGFGSYAAATMLMLVGRYDQVAVDSVYRAFVMERYFADREPVAGEVESVYDAWGSWKYLGYWFDLWHDTQEVA